MSENQNPMDLLAEDLSSVDMSPTLFADRSHVVFEVSSLDDTQTEAGDRMFVYTLKTLNEAKTNKPGKSFEVGKEYKHRISLTPVTKKGDDNLPNVRRNLKEFRLACTGDPAGSFGNPEQYVGKRVTAVMSIRKSTNPEFQDNNSCRFLAPGNGSAATDSGASM